MRASYKSFFRLMVPSLSLVALLLSNWPAEARGSHGGVHHTSHRWSSSHLGAHRKSTEERGSFGARAFLCLL